MEKLFKNKYVIELLDLSALELVLYQADNVKELSKLCDLKEKYIYDCLCKNRKKIRVYNKFFKIRIVNIVD